MTRMARGVACGRDAAGSGGTAPAGCFGQQRESEVGEICAGEAMARDAGGCGGLDVGDLIADHETTGRIQ